MKIKELNPEDSAIVHAFTRALHFKKEFKITPSNFNQMPLLYFLQTTHDNITNEMPDLLHEKNHEEEFKINHVLDILKYVFQDNKNGLRLRCDIPSQAYKNTDT